MQRQILFKFEEVFNLLEIGSIESAANAFIKLIDFLIHEMVHYDNYLFFEQLFKLDQLLTKVNRIEFWNFISKQNSQIDSLPDNQKIYINGLLKKHPLAWDIYRINELNSLCDKYRNEIIFQYLLAIAYKTEGDEVRDKLKLEKALEIFKNIAPLVHENQTFYANRINALDIYTKFITLEEAKTLIEENLKVWIHHTPFHPDFVIRLRAIEDLINIKFQIKKDFEEKVKEYDNKIKEYETSHIEILSIFSTLITLTIGGLSLVRKQPNFQESLKLLLCLFFVLIMLHIFLVSLLKFKKFWHSLIIIFIYILLMLFSLIFIFHPSLYQN